MTHLYRFSRSLRLLLLACVVIALSQPLFAQVAITVSFGPPALPVYEQPLCPAEGYIWTPGYWAWDPDYGYYWVPGTWVLAPEPGYLWTPPWWGWENGAYLFHSGYWGPTVGFYGGINYGYGYSGRGFEGGRWDHDHFYYNRSVTNVNVTNIHNVYNETVVNRGGESRVSYNGGQGGLTARPSAQEEAAAHEHHLAPVAAQTQHIQQARGNPELRARTNQGKPPIAATQKPAAFTGHVVAARAAGAPYHPPANNGRTAGTQGHPGAAAARPNEPRPPAPSSTNTATHTAPVHARELPSHQAAAPPVSPTNTKQQQTYQQQQEKLAARQNQQHQKLAQQQTREDQRATQRNYSQQQNQQMEQRHQQQTQQMEQRHTTQTQQLQQRQAPPHGNNRPQ